MDWQTDSVGGNSQRTPRLSDLCETVDFRDGKPHTLRPVGPALRIARHWITTKSKEGKKNKPFPKICLGYNSKSGEFDGECPYCEAGIRASIEVHQNVIDRDAQEDGPPKKAGEPTKAERKEREFLGYTGYFKESIDTKVWTPVKVAVLGTSPALKVKDTVAVNKVKGKDGTKKTYPPQHPKYGYDLVITYHDDKKRAATDRYSVVKDERNALSEEELDYHLWFLGLEKPEKLSVAKEEMSRLKKRLWREEGEEDEDDDEDRPKKKKRHQEEDDGFDEKSSKKSKKRSRDEDEDDDDEDDRKSKSKKRSRDWDDEDSEDDDDEDRPKKKSKSKRRDDDEDDEEDDEDDRRSRKSKSSKKRFRDDDDDDEDEEDEEEDRPKSKKSSKRKSRDEDDDDEDEDDKPRKKKRSRDTDDEDEDEDRPKKKKRRNDDDEDDEDDRKSSKKSSKKRSLKDADGDEDDWDSDEDDE